MQTEQKIATSMPVPFFWISSQSHVVLRDLLNNQLMATLKSDLTV